MNIGKPQNERLINNCKIRKEMKELDKTIISNRIIIKGESLTYNRIHRLIYQIYIDVTLQFDYKLRSMYTLLNWI